MTQHSWRYTAIDAEGRTRRGRISASAEEAAHSSLRAQNLTPLELTLSESRQQLSRSLNSQEAEALIHQLARLMRHGASLEQALEATGEAPSTPQTALAANMIRHDLHQGRKLSQSFQSLAASLPPHAAAMAAAGESSGEMAQALARLAQDMAHARKLRDDLSMALIYPFFLLIAALASISLLLGWVAPQLKHLVAGEAAAFEAQMLIVASDVFLQTWPYALACLVMLCLLWPIASTHQRGRAFLHAALDKAPFLGRQMRLRDCARWARALAALIHGGAALPAALEVAQGTMASPRLQAQVQNVKTLITQGASFAAALKENGEWPPLLLRQAHIGAQSGRLDEALDAAAQMLEEDAEIQTKRLIAALGPAMVLLMGALIGGFVAVTFSAVLSINDLAL